MKRKIKWEGNRLEIMDISIRRRRKDDNSYEEYAVLKVPLMDSFDALTHNEFPKRKRFQDIALMCFDVNLYGHFVIGEIYSFEGFLSFRYGSTYLVIERAVDIIGKVVGNGESLGECITVKSFGFE